MEIFKDERYKHLLVPSIFNVSIKNIIPSIELAEEFNIGPYITNRCLRRNVTYQRALMEYLVEKKIPLVISKQDGKNVLNPILNASNTDLKNKYNIDIKELVEKEAKK